MQLSSVFSNGARIDSQYTGEGNDISPPLSWSDVPDGVMSFVLICDDPDAPSPRQPAKEPWVHWVIFNIPNDVTVLPEGLPRAASLSELRNTEQGMNSWPRDNIGYRGPMPPPGSGVHRYVFHLFALDTRLNLRTGRATKGSVLRAMEGHVLDNCQLVGTYERG